MIQNDYSVHRVMAPKQFDFLARNDKPKRNSKNINYHYFRHIPFFFFFTIYLHNYTRLTSSNEIYAESIDKHCTASTFLEQLPKYKNCWMERKNSFISISGIYRSNSFDLQPSKNPFKSCHTAASKERDWIEGDWKLRIKGKKD